jgi:hypothetical protein
MGSLSEEVAEQPGLKGFVNSLFRHTSTNDRDNTAAEEAPQDNDGEEELVDKDAQAGVQRVQAAAQIWTKWQMIGAYVW